MTGTVCAGSAVDNILLRLRAARVPVLRLGRPASVHPGLRDCLPGGALWPDSSVAALRALPRRAGVVSLPSLLTPALALVLRASLTQEILSSSRTMMRCDRRRRQEAAGSVDYGSNNIALAAEPSIVGRNLPAHAGEGVAGGARTGRRRWGAQCWVWGRPC